MILNLRLTRPVVSETERRATREMLRSHVPSRAPLALFCHLLLLLLLLLFAAADPSPPVTCSKTCVAQNCDSIGIRYGKYCGVGWSGCPGEKPCDDLDDCCRLHDDCVEKKGMMSVKCHEKFKNCIRKVKKTGKKGFSTECSYETAMPTMIQGMDMAILFSQIGNPKVEL